MNIYLTRHAQKDNSQKYNLKDHFNRTLTQVGLKQAKELANYLSQYQINKIFSSNMPRALMTAEEVGSKIGISAVVKSPSLREADPCVIPNHPDRDKIKIQCWQEWGFKPKHGESYNEGEERFSNFFWDEIVESCSDQENILIVSHGRVMRLFLFKFLVDGKKVIKEPYSHVAITHLKIDKQNKELKILRYNDNSFLPEDLRI